LKLPFIKLDRNASVIAVLALLISITQVAVQVYRSWAYPRVEVLAPNEVQFVADFDPSRLNERQHINVQTQLVATLVYYHPGSSSRNAVLMSQSATVLIGNRKLPWAGQHLGRFKLPSDSWKWTFVEEGTLPVLIKPQEAVRTEVLFAPRIVRGVLRKDESISWEDFFALMPNVKTIRIRIDSEFAGHRHVLTEFDLNLPLWFPRQTNVQSFDVAGSAAKQTELPGK